MYLIDTNIHIAYLLQDSFEIDEQTHKYMSLYETISFADRVVPDFILGEFETFMMQVAPSRYKLDTDEKKRLKQFTLNYLQQLITECTIVTPEVQTMQRASTLYFENAKMYYLSFTDCLVLATAQQHGYTIFTKDKRLITTAKKHSISFFQPQE